MESPANAGDAGSIPGPRRSLGNGKEMATHSNVLGKQEDQTSQS